MTNARLREHSNHPCMLAQERICHILLKHVCKSLLPLQEYVGYLDKDGKFIVYPAALKATAEQCQVDLLRESLKDEEKEVPLVQRQVKPNKFFQLGVG